MAIKQESAEDAYQTVLAHAGCAMPNRDSLYTRIIEEVHTDTATRGNNGFISSPSNAGVWPDLQSGTAYVDSDHDGMADAWEIDRSLNPDNRNYKDTIGTICWSFFKIVLITFSQNKPGR